LLGFASHLQQAPAAAPDGCSILVGIASRYNVNASSLILTGDVEDEAPTEFVNVLRGLGVSRWCAVAQCRRRRRRT
jgi:hypothetical protein